ncbi:DUF5683 domain-containing protein [Altibacter sp. HG106]|uniref:DUF5683 domain-containing protein n=1 Tax=Altibacter sp. HG106 TaxID=3023937 RepID=UPI00234FD99E|nr:DUF5683 domain-containing protein [Altibacter sp. HG106]MDC7995541.1 DUF5683 domain-containing protein [Altibacter sp. HG106]
MVNKLLYLCCFFITTAAWCQVTDAIQSTPEDAALVVNDTVANNTSVVAYDPLAPSKAAFYSAVVPGLGQAYNKRYWKIPVIYAGIAAGVYFYVQNDKDYDRFRNAYKRRLAGFTDDEFFGTGSEPVISNDRLIDAQKNAQKNKDVSILVAIGFYLLNIVDANVDAHLRQFNVSEDLSLQPKVEVDPIRAQTQYGLSFRYNLQ